MADYDADQSPLFWSGPEGNRKRREVRDLVEEYEKEENSFFCIACRTYIDLRAPKNERPPCPYGVGYSNQHTFEPAKPTEDTKENPLSKGRHVRVYDGKSTSHPAEGCNNFPKCLDDEEGETDDMTKNRERPSFHKGDLVFSNPCLVELSEDVPSHFRYTVEGWCETCEDVHVLEIGQLGRRWKKKSKVKMKTRVFTVTYEFLLKLLEENDHLPENTEILSAEDNQTRDMLTFKIYNEDFDNFHTPEGGEYREISSKASFDG